VQRRVPRDWTSPRRRRERSGRRPCWLIGEVEDGGRRVPSARAAARLASCQDPAAARAASGGPRAFACRRWRRAAHQRPPPPPSPAFTALTLTATRRSLGTERCADCALRGQATRAKLDAFSSRLSDAGAAWQCLLLGAAWQCLLLGAALPCGFAGGGPISAANSDSGGESDKGLAGIVSSRRQSRVWCWQRPRAAAGRLAGGPHDSRAPPSAQSFAGFEPWGKFVRPRRCRCRSPPLPERHRAWPPPASRSTKLPGAARAAVGSIRHQQWQCQSLETVWIAMK
jgi:hypothetical protein